MTMRHPWKSSIGCLWVFSVLAVGSTNAAVPLKPACSADALSCEFYIQTALRETMVLAEKSPLGSIWVPVEAREDGLYTTGAPFNCQGPGHKLTDEQAANVIIGDGTYRTAYAVNDSVPGPPMVVYEGQQIIIHFTNNLGEEAVTLHMHGLHQRGTPWMDGAGGVSQCLVAPGETFTYRIKAEITGTYWYHAHHGSEFSMGLHGALVILHRSHEIRNSHRPLDPLPTFAEEYAFFVQDWMDVTSAEVNVVTAYGAFQYSFDGLESPHCNHPPAQPDGAIVTLWPFYSAIINGKGRHYKVSEDGEHIYTNPFTPLEVFPVTEGDKYYFRVICSSLTFPFSISIDGHPLHVVASDGHDFVTEVVDFLVVNSGERYDFWIDATNPGGLGNFWIHAETLEVELQGSPIRPNHVEAILRYPGSPLEDPESTRRECTEKNPCRALNCLYRIMPERFHTVCVTLDDLRLPISDDSNLEDDGDVIEYFFDIQVGPLGGKEGTAGMHPFINGIKHIAPPYPPQIFKDKIEDMWIPCDFDSCPGMACACSHVVKVPLGSTVDMVFFAQHGEDNPTKSPHPMHIHGYTPQVVKMGWPSYDAKTQRAMHGSDAIICDDPQCKGADAGAARWAQASWRGGHMEGMVTTLAAYKDTVIVPAGGYIVLRFKADNPGFWLMHCHIENHALDGMALVVQVGEPSDMTPAPARMERCGDFALTEAEYYGATEVQRPKMDDVVLSTSDTSCNLSTSQEVHSHGGYQIAIGVLTAMCVCLILALVVMYRKFSYRRDYAPLLADDETSASVSVPAMMYTKNIITRYDGPAK